MFAPIADVRRLTIHDGPGIRDTVFVKGCPLHCLWCHNPECISAEPRLLFVEKLCRSCRSCMSVCPAGVHSFDSAGTHEIDRRSCRHCGACVDACLQDALSICGQKRSASDLLKLFLRDSAFFGPDGGVTVSGGEPLLYPDFVRELFSLLRRESIHTALDTCGAVPFESFEKVLPVTSLILFDLKGMNPERHKINTGSTPELIHDNLFQLGTMGIPIEIRMPVVPGCNDAEEEFLAAGKLLSKIPSLTRVRLLAYQSMARSKYRSAGLADTMPSANSPELNFLRRRADLLRPFLPEIEILLPAS